MDTGRWDGVVSIATGLWAGQPKNYGLIPGRGKRYLSSTKCPDRIWGPASLLLNGYREYFPTG